MTKENYINMVVDELIKINDLKNKSSEQLSFYKEVNGSESLEYKEALKNLELATEYRQKIERLIYLPVYELIDKLSDKAIENYKKKEIDKLLYDIKVEDNKINEFNNCINRENKKLEEMLGKYSSLTNVKNSDNNVLKKCIESSKESSKYINEYKKEIEKAKSMKSYLNEEISKIKKYNKNDVKKEILIKHGLLYMIDELEKYKVDRTDEIVVNLCKDLNILDKVIEKINEYLILKDLKIQKHIKLPETFKMYNLYNNNGSLNEYLIEYTDAIYHERTNQITVYYEEDILDIVDSLKKIKEDVNNDKNDLLEFKNELDELSNKYNYSINDTLISYVNNLFDKLHKDKNKVEFNKIYDKYLKYKYDKRDTQSNSIKRDNLEKIIYFEIDNILDEYWEYLSNQLEIMINNVNHNAEFKYDVSSINIKEDIKEYSLIIDKEHFSDLGLINMKILIDNVLNTYNDILNNIELIIKDCDKYKNELNEESNNKETKMINLTNEINELYKDNYNPILISDYEPVSNVFKDNKVSVSLAKVYRKNLIDNIRTEALKQTFNINNISENINAISNYDARKKYMKKIDKSI